MDTTTLVLLIIVIICSSIFLIAVIATILKRRRERFDRATARDVQPSELLQQTARNDSDIVIHGKRNGKPRCTECGARCKSSSIPNSDSSDCTTLTNELSTCSRCSARSKKRARCKLEMVREEVELHSPPRPADPVPPHHLPIRHEPRFSFPPQVQCRTCPLQVPRCPCPPPQEISMQSQNPLRMESLFQKVPLSTSGAPSIFVDNVLQQAKEKSKEQAFHDMCTGRGRSCSGQVTSKFVPAPAVRFNGRINQIQSLLNANDSIRHSMSQQNGAGSDLSSYAASEENMTQRQTQSPRRKDNQVAASLLRVHVTDGSENDRKPNQVQVRFERVVEDPEIATECAVCHQSTLGYMRCSQCFPPSKRKSGSDTSGSGSRAPERETRTPTEEDFLRECQVEQDISRFRKPRRVSCGVPRPSPVKGSRSRGKRYRENVESECLKRTMSENRNLTRAVGEVTAALTKYIETSKKKDIDFVNKNCVQYLRE